jgi:D-glycero-alpha-D-manno-heptose-7-phosphate kinase
MIISKTPYRISFFGGGSDYPVWYQKYGGSVISTTIDKYLYISLRELPKFFNHKYRIVYSKVEQVNSINNIEHHVIRKGLKRYNIKNHLEIHYDGEMPAKSGVGSSSSFIVGFLNILENLKNNSIKKNVLAKKSILFEQKILNENVGSQDQVAAAYGGFNHIIFYKNKDYSVNKINIKNHFFENLNRNLFLIYTGIQRTSSLVSSTYINKLITSKKTYIDNILDIVCEAKKVIQSKKNLNDFGKLLHETWILKKNLSNVMSSKKIDDIYSYCINNGALGGKILGAGSGGFLLVYVPRNKQKKLLSEIKKKNLVIPFNFSSKGSEIIYKSKKI